MLVSALLLLLVGHVVLPGAMSQRPFYAQSPWMDRFGVIPDEVTTRAPTAQQPGGLGERIFVPVGVSFRYFNNVPIQGPESPCVGCRYTLTNQGFIRS